MMSKIVVIENRSAGVGATFGESCDGNGKIVRKNAGTSLLPDSDQTIIMSNATILIPEWAFELHRLRRTVILNYIDPLVIFLLRPLIPDDVWTQQNITSHRRLGILPSYIEDVSAFRETSMSFASFFMLFFIMTCLASVFLSCFYHNQKTSPLFISPRRHRLPKLVPPPLPVDGIFSWIKICFFVSDEEVRQSSLVSTLS
jgi:hypothetical protein